MTYESIIKVFPAIKELRKLRLPYDKTKVIYDMRKLLEPEYNFFLEEEAKLINEFSSKNENGEPRITSNGLIMFDTLKDRQRYNEKIEELRKTDCEIPIRNITITKDDIGKQLIAEETLENLEGFVTFN